MHYGRGGEKPRLIQFWTDPLSLGRCDSVDDIPKSRIIHKWQEHRLLRMADKVVFCYPLLKNKEAELHPEYAEKMTWSDISYIPHENKNRPNNQKPLIGFFGAYQSHVRNIEPLLNAIKMLPQFDFVIRGDGNLPYDVSDIPNLDLIEGRKPLAEIERLEQQCDILISLSGKSGITHPAGKTFYYAAYNKPILHIGDGVNADYFKKYLEEFDNRFEHCMNDTDEIASSIKKIVDTYSQFNLKIPRRMDAAVIARRIIEE